MDTTASDSAIYSSTEYLNSAKKFNGHVKDVRGQRERKSAVVLDVFAGVGTGILVLKKLQIAMEKVRAYTLVTSGMIYFSIPFFFVLTTCVFSVFRLYQLKCVHLVSPTPPKKSLYKHAYLSIEVMM